MITGFLLLPVFAVLAWLYWYFLPGSRAWGWFDSLLLPGVIVLAAVYVVYVGGLEFEHAGSLWPEIVAVVGAYAILTGGLALGLAWRYRQSK
jgi:hypothetical protein